MMPETHWKKVVDTNFLGSWDLPTKKLVLQISSVKKEKVYNQHKGAEESCAVAYFDSKTYKPMILNKTNCKTMQLLTESPYIENWNILVEINVERVKYKGEMTDGLRISKTAPAKTTATPTTPPPKTESEPLKCEDCSGAITEYGGYKPEQIALSTKGKYGRVLCATCAQKAKAAKEGAE